MKGKLKLDGRQRVVIENVQPQIDAGRFPIKRVIGQNVEVKADAFTDSHDALACVLRYRHESEPAGVKLPCCHWAMTVARVVSAHPNLVNISTLSLPGLIIFFPGSMNLYVAAMPRISLWHFGPARYWWRGCGACRRRASVAAPTVCQGVARCQAGCRYSTGAFRNPGELDEAIFGSQPGIGLSRYAKGMV